MGVCGLRFWLLGFVGFASLWLCDRWVLLGFDSYLMGSKIRSES